MNDLARIGASYEALVRDSKELMRKSRILATDGDDEATDHAIRAVIALTIGWIHDAGKEDDDAAR